MAGETPTTAFDHLTSAAKGKWVEQDLGTQIRLVNVMGGAFGTDGAGNRIMYAGLMGQPEVLVAVDPDTNTVKRVLDVSQADGSYDMLVTKDGTVYLASHPNGNLYRHKPGNEQIENLGRVTPECTFIWEVAEGPKGKIYGACYPKSKLIEFDPETNKIRDLGTVVAGEDYARCLAWDEKRQKLYIGIGSHAGLVEYDPANGMKRNLLPEKYISEHFVYSLGLAGDRLIVRLDPSNQAVVLNLNTREVEATLPEMNSNCIAVVPGDNGAIFFTGSGELMKYDPVTRRSSGTGIRIGNTGGRAFTVVTAPDGKTSAVQVLMNNGKVATYDLARSQGALLDSKLPGQPIHIHNIACGRDGNIYSSGYVVGQVGVYDPRTEKQNQFGGVKQAEGITTWDSRLYFGTYPRAVISTYDTSAPLGKNNPREVFRLEDHGQDRPFGMLAVPQEQKVFIGTVPGYGLLGGALSVYDPVTSDLQVYRDLIEKQSIVTLAYADGLLYGGTSIYGGLGIEPVEAEGKLFIWDVKKKEKVFDVVPIAGKRGISGLRFGPDGNLWGWAEGTLFIFDLKERKVTWSEEKLFAKETPRHFWRGGYMTELYNGQFYGMLFGQVYQLDPLTKQVTVLAQGKDLELMTHDDLGRLYFVQRDRLLRMAKLP